MSEQAEALYFLTLDRPCEEKLATLVDEYNALADRWQQANERAEQAEAELAPLRTSLAAATEGCEEAKRHAEAWGELARSRNEDLERVRTSLAELVEALEYLRRVVGPSTVQLLKDRNVPELIQQLREALEWRDGARGDTGHGE